MKWGWQRKERFDRVGEKIKKSNELIKYFKEITLSPEEINPYFDRNRLHGNNPKGESIFHFIETGCKYKWIGKFL